MSDDRHHELIELRRELAWLKRQIRGNEQVWAGFRRIEIRMIGAATLPDVVEVLVKGFPALFPSVDCVSLSYIDPEYELVRLLSTGRDAALARAFIPVPDEKALTALFPQPARPQLGRCRPDLQSLLFPDHAGQLGSVALAPLVLRGRVVGSLNQASRDPKHFTAEAATDLLEHLAAVTAMCVENAASRERLKQDGLTDALTGIANRRFFERRLREEMERWTRHGRPLACMLVDVDHFKEVNDRLGHLAGDAVLQRIARTLGQDLRASDVLARYGGEEFVLLLPDTPAQQAASIAERLRRGVEEAGASDGDGRACAVTVSLGLACLAGDMADRSGVTGEWLLQRADVALYQAKQTGRNKTVIATPVD